MSLNECSTTIYVEEFLALLVLIAAYRRNVIRCRTKLLELQLQYRFAFHLSSSSVPLSSKHLDGELQNMSCRVVIS